MKKRLIFEVEEGVSRCHKCPFGVEIEDSFPPQYACKDTMKHFNCDEYDLSTLKFIGEESSTISKQGNEND